jgi:hypothetical protein
MADTWPQVMRVSSAARLASRGPLQRVFEIRRREVGRMELEPPQALENRALQKFRTDRRGGGESQQILRSWFARLRKQVDPDTTQYGRQIWDAVRVLEGIREGVTGLFWLDEIVGNRKERAARFDLWAWPTDAEVDHP